jgi:hypothetical protein
MAAAVFAGLGLFAFYISNAPSYLGDKPETCVNCHIMAPHFTTWCHSSHVEKTRKLISDVSANPDQNLILFLFINVIVSQVLILPSGTFPCRLTRRVLLPAFPNSQSFNFGVPGEKNDVYRQECHAITIAKNGKKCRSVEF